MRLQNWSYGSNGKHFITICTCENEHFFGKIANEKMYLNTIGELADKYWYEIPNHFPYVHLDQFTVMPITFMSLLNLMTLMVDAVGKIMTEIA
ncbi:MAG: hypothetical protein N4A59_00760 [Marinifilum sp.]|jgi:hypothetical protein|nr:hypothetical protein [Marinifilum sp.]